MGNGSTLQNNLNVGIGKNPTPKKSKKKKSRSGSSRKKKKKTMTLEQSLAAKSVTEWVFLDSNLDSGDSAFEAMQRSLGVGIVDKVVFELHSHSICSDGYLSPTAVVERAHRNGVKVLALTDHDTMSGIPQALEAACKFGVKIIPGVEISTIFSPRGESGIEEPVHVLAYYGSCGPTRPDELETCLANIREGRYLRAKNMLSKLNNLKMPLKWEHVARIAGNGVAPGRLHVARAMVEAGHVENLKQAFNRYLHDGGPAYSTGNELRAEEAVQLVCRTGGFAALAHPWALKNPTAIIKRLKDAGLHGIEVYRSDGKLAGFSDLAVAYDLIKLGGSDYHGRGTNDESDLGSVNLPVLCLHEFLKVARPIWCDATIEVLKRFTEEPSDSNLDQLTKFGRIKHLKEGSTKNYRKDVIDLCLASWLTNEERQAVEFEALTLKFYYTGLNQSDVQVPVTNI